MKRCVICLELVICIVLTCINVSVAGSEMTLTLPLGIKSLERESFAGITSVETVVLPDGIESIGEKAFADSSVKHINLPDSLTFIADDAFDGCLLESLDITESTYSYSWAREHGYRPEAHALLIGQKSFLRSVTYYDEELEKDVILYQKEVTNRNQVDTVALEGMLQRVQSSGGVPFQTTRKIDLSSSQIKDAIQSTFSENIDGDIALFFIATHGESSGDGELEMAFTGDENNPDDINAYYQGLTHLSFDTLAEWLSQYVRGKVIVIIESCGSGSSIYVSDDEQNSSIAKNKKNEKEAYLPEVFVQEAVKAFSSVDGIGEIKPDKPGIKSTGGMRKPRFYVLAAARHHEDSWGESNSASNPMNYFTRWLIDGIGVNGNSPADSNYDSKLSLTELFDYIKRIGDNWPFTYYGNTYYQHVQRYPIDSEEIIFQFP